MSSQQRLHLQISEEIVVDFSVGHVGRVVVVGVVIEGDIMDDGRGCEGVTMLLQMRGVVDEVEEVVVLAVFEA